MKERSLRLAQGDRSSPLPILGFGVLPRGALPLSVPRNLVFGPEVVLEPPEFWPFSPDACLDRRVEVAWVRPCECNNLLPRDPPEAEPHADDRLDRNMPVERPVADGVEERDRLVDELVLLVRILPPDVF